MRKFDSIYDNYDILYNNNFSNINLSHDMIWWYTCIIWRHMIWWDMIWRDMKRDYMIWYMVIMIYHIGLIVILVISAYYNGN